MFIKFILAKGARKKASLSSLRSKSMTNAPFSLVSEKITPSTPVGDERSKTSCQRSIGNSDMKVTSKSSEYSP